MSDIKHADICGEKNVHPALLSEVKARMPDDEKLFDLSEFFKVFGDSTRMKMLFVLFEAEVCTCDLAEVLNMTPSAVSHQLNVLKRTKLVKCRREGKAVFYSLSDEHVRSIISMAMEHIEE